MTVLLDDGLQPERTRLAWRRTVLAGVTGSAVAVRLLPEVLGAGGLALAVCALVWSVTVAVLAERRARAVVRWLRDGAAPPGAGVLAVLAAGVSGTSAVAVVGVLVLRHA